MKSQIIAGHWDLVFGLTHVDLYACLHGGDFVSGEASVKSIVSTSGTLRNLRINLIECSTGSPQPPGEGRYRTYTVRKNGVDTELEVTIANEETEGSDLVHEVPVVAGDIMTLRLGWHEDTGTDSYTRWVCEFEGANAKESLICAGGEVFHYYLSRFGPWSTTGVSSQEEDVRQICAVSGVIKNFYVSLDRAPSPGSDKGFIFTLRKDGVDTSLTVTITGDNTEGSDTTNSVSVSPGDIITIGQIRTPAGDPIRNAVTYFGFTFVADTDEEQPFPFGAESAPSHIMDTTNITYNYIVYRQSVWETEPWIRQQYAMSCTLSKLNVRLNVAPGSGKSWTFTVMKNGTPTDLVATIADMATLGQDNVHEVAITTDDMISLRCEPSGTPAAAYAYGGLKSTWRTVTSAEVETHSATNITKENATWEATLNGKLVDDGEQDCEVRFQYGLDTDYGTDTPWVSQAEGSFSKAITGLIADTIYHFRAQAKNASGIVSGVDMEFGTYGTVYPVLALSRVTNLIHRWTPGTYTLEVAIGDVSTQFGLPQYATPPPPGAPPTPEPTPTPPPDCPPPVTIVCPSGQRMMYDIWDTCLQHPYCVSADVPPGPTPCPPPVTKPCAPGYRMMYDTWDTCLQHPYCVKETEPPYPPPTPPPDPEYYACKKFIEQLEQGRQEYMRWTGIYISLEDYARALGRLWQLTDCQRLLDITPGI